MAFGQLLRGRRTLWILILLAGVLTGAAAGGLFALTRDLPQIRSLESYQPSEVTRVFSRDGIVLDELYAQKRERVPLERIPDFLKSAVIATEDRNFYRHSGVDLKGILRAAWRDIIAGEFKEGASTISQQLTKTLFLTPRKSLLRKIREAILAFQLERRYTKDEILQLYLNQIYLGSGAYGVESAARVYFGRSVTALDLAQCALIAGLPKAPSRYSPLVNPRLAIRRRNTVLAQMVATGIIDESRRRRAAERGYHPPAGGRSKRAPYFVDEMRRKLEDTLGSRLLYEGGLTVRTTLDYRLQQAARQAVTQGLEALDTRLQHSGRQAVKPQAALVAIEVDSGAILAMVGGRDYTQSVFNRAVDARRQPGSAFKPVMFACAIAQGFRQNDLLLDAPVVFKGADGGRDYQPRNHSREYSGEITLRLALARSKNIPAVRLMESLGPASVIRFAHQLGISTPLGANLSLALGTSEMSLLELTGAYAVFANRGDRIAPYGIEAVIGRSGRTLWRHTRRRQAVLSRATAAIVTDMLQAVVREGTGTRARSLGGSLAGKTGTTNAYKDALFIGFSPTVATGVWAGSDDFASLGPGETGSRAALPIWMAFMQTVLAQGADGYFDLPDDTVRVSIDPVSGQARDTDAAGGVPALFKSGTEPRP